MPRGERVSEPQGGERIQKLLSRAGVASRREAERWLAEGRISVNGSVITTPGTKVDPLRDYVKVDGRPLRGPAPPVYYLLNKPDGCLTSTRDPRGRPVVTDLLHSPARVFPVGRLDYHTTGLLILTNDGDLADRMLRPATGCPKVYHAKVRGLPSGETLRRLSRGLKIDGKRTLPCKVTPLRGEKHAWIEVVLTEGRQNQVRRMFSNVRHPVMKLRRVAIGPLKDAKLAPGQYRRLSPREVKRLKECLG